MDTAEKQKRGLTENQLKLLALLSMTIDHIGVVFFPKILLFRILGRLAFPIFSYGVWQGCRYTRHPERYLARLSGLGVVCFFVYFFFDGEVYGNVLITLSLSACILLPLRALRAALARPGGDGRSVLWSAAGFFGSIALAAALCYLFPVDYGFCGVMLPVFPALLEGPFGAHLPYLSQKEDRTLPALGFFAGLILLSLALGGYQFYCCLALLLLLAANGRRGRFRLKYLFYLYYPLHLLALELLYLLLHQFGLC